MDYLNSRLSRSPILPTPPKGEDMNDKERMFTFLKNLLQVVREGRELTYDDLQTLLTRVNTWNVAVPASAAAAGVAGQYAYDTNYFYICVAADTWMRVAIGTWA